MPDEITTGEPTMEEIAWIDFDKTGLTIVSTSNRAVRITTDTMKRAIKSSEHPNFQRSRVSFRPCSGCGGPKKIEHP